MSHKHNDIYYEDLREELEGLNGEIYNGESPEEAINREYVSQNIFGLSRKQVVQLLNGAPNKAEKLITKHALRLNFGKNLEKLFDRDSVQDE